MDRERGKFFTMYSPLITLRLDLPTVFEHRAVRLVRPLLVLLLVVGIGACSTPGGLDVARGGVAEVVGI
jgi:hypothetical protein